MLIWDMGQSHVVELAKMSRNGFFTLYLSKQLLSYASKSSQMLVRHRAFVVGINLTSSAAACKLNGH